MGNVEHDDVCAVPGGRFHGLIPRLDNPEGQDTNATNTVNIPFRKVLTSIAKEGYLFRVSVIAKDKGTVRRSRMPEELSTSQEPVPRAGENAKKGDIGLPAETRTVMVRIGTIGIGKEGKEERHRTDFLLV